MPTGPTTGLDPPLPHSLEAERAILGAIQLDGAVLAECERLGAEDFFQPENRRIFSCYRELQAEGVDPGDMVLLVERLHQNGELEAAGGAGYISSLADGLPRKSNIRHYVEIVQRKKTLRDAIHGANTLMADAFQPDADPTAIISRTLESLSFHLRKCSWKETNRTMFETGPDLPTEDAPTEFEFYPLAPCGCLSDLAGDPKLAGKTTMALLAVKAKLNGEEFLGYPTKKGPVVYLSEQSKASFRASCRRAGVAGYPDLHILYYSKCRTLTWPQIAALAGRKCQEVGATLLVIDTINQFAGLTGDSENNAGDALSAIAPLQAATAEGITVLTLSHDRKSGGEVGKSRRGSSAFAGAADCCFSLRRMEGQGRSTMRRILYAGRFDDIANETVIELTETIYIAHGDGAAVAESEAHKKILENAPESESEAVDHKTLLEMADVKPGGTANRTIEKMLAPPTPELLRVGCGRRGDPYKYYRNSILSNYAPIGGNKEIAKPKVAVLVPIGPRIEGQSPPGDYPSDEILL